MSLTGRNLTCARGDAVVFAGLDFDIARGGIVVARGANGSGKTSLLRLAAGYLAPSVGEIRRDGTPVADDPQRHRASLHYIGHLDAVKPALSVAENLTFWGHALTAKAGTLPRPGVGQALDRMGLAGLADMPARYLSAGQRRRLALARLVASPRPLWLLDEPTASLDAAGMETVLDLVSDHRSGGGMVLAAVPRPFRRRRCRHDPVGGGPRGWSVMTVFLRIVVRDVRLAFGQGGGTMPAVVFFLLAVTLFPLGIGPETGILRRIAPGVIWVAALLAAMLSLDRLFQADFEDGSLDQLALTPLPLELVAAAKWPRALAFPRACPCSPSRRCSASCSASTARDAPRCCWPWPRARRPSAWWAASGRP